ncbi:Protein of unknown function (DUF3522) [Blomia tropicalis]|nr:Protein of unknown function (DUF3522) [Blomia tropicalis]
MAKNGRNGDGKFSHQTQMSFGLVDAFIIQDLNNSSSTMFDNSTTPMTTTITIGNNGTTHSSIWTRTWHLNPMNDYLVLSQNLFLVVSNFFMLPVIYLAIRLRYRGEAIIYILTMLASSFYHLCDSEQVNFCIAKYDTLQFMDFFCAIMTLWVTALILANVPQKWISSYHLGGSVFFALLLRNNVVGFLTFIIPAACSIILLGGYWGHKYYRERQLPSMIHSRNFIFGSIMSGLGIILFAIQQQDGLIIFYGFTHSAWHVCMALAITFLLPSRNGVSLFYYTGKRYNLNPTKSSSTADLTNNSNDGQSKRNDDYHVSNTLESNGIFNPAYVDDSNTVSVRIPYDISSNI